MKFNQRYTSDERRDFSDGLPDYHDPTAGIGGAAPTYSALSLRLALAIAAIVLCAGVAVLGFVLGIAWLYWPMIAVIVLALIDIVIIVRRKRRGEPG